MSHYYQLAELLDQVDEPFRTACKKLLIAEQKRLQSARGSTHNHQAWPGGYLDHIREVMNIAATLYGPLNERRKLPFSLSDALIVLFAHDLEKPWAFEQVDGKWQRAAGYRQKEDAQAFRLAKLAEHGINLTKELEQALYFTEGEIGHYSSTNRNMSPLATFCHMCDVASARIWFDQPHLHDPWSGSEQHKGTRTLISQDVARALVDAATCALVIDAGQRHALGEALLSVARELSAAEDDVEDPTLWSAVRRLGSLLPADELDVLREFLRNGLRGTTHQVTLQALQAAYAVEPPDAPRSEALRDRVTALARTTLGPEQLTSPSALALAANAFAAAVLLGGAEVPELTRRLLATEQRPLLKQAQRNLNAAAEGRATVVPPPGPLPQLESALDALRGALGT